MSGFDVGENAFVSSSYASIKMGPNPTTERGRPSIINCHPTLPLIIYASGKSIVVRNIEKPSECFIYRGHSAPTSVAKFSPNGFWVASADTHGKIRVWAWDNPEHLTKLVCPVFTGVVCDLDWDMESKKIAACGENGSGHLVKCFMWDTGNTTGDMLGHTKRVSSLAYKPNRPFRIMTGSEDFKTCFYSGPPFKLTQSDESHTNYVNSVRYSMDGNVMISVGTDKKIIKYDGKTGSPSEGGVITNAHEGGIYGVAFSPDGSQFATASADKTVKLWSTSSMELMQTFKPASDPQLGDMQVAVFWSKVSGLMSLSLNGTINLIGSSDGSMREMHFHQMPITAMALDPVSKKLVTGSSDGVICNTSIDSLNDMQRLRGADKRNVSGSVHSNKVIGISVQDGKIISVGWDDKMRFGAIKANCMSTEVPLEGQPCALAMHSSSDLAVVITTKEIALFRGDAKVASYDMSRVSWTALCGDLLKEEEVIVGGSDNKSHIFSISGLTFVEIKTIDTRAAVTAVSYSPLGDLIAIGDAGRQVEVYERKDWMPRIKDKWVHHTSRISSLAWSPSGGYLASGSLDESIYIWNYAAPSKKLHLPLAHVGGITHLVWGTVENQLFSAGNDAVVINWHLPQII